MKGVIDTVPGVRSLLIVYDNLKIELDELLKLLVAIEENINDDDVRNAKLVRYEERECLNEVKWLSHIYFFSRVVSLPLAFRDKWTLDAIKVYQDTVRASAPYVPDNGIDCTVDGGHHDDNDVDMI